MQVCASIVRRSIVISSIHSSPSALPQVICGNRCVVTRNDGKCNERAEREKYYLKLRKCGQNVLEIVYAHIMQMHLAENQMHTCHSQSIIHFGRCDKSSCTCRCAIQKLFNKNRWSPLIFSWLSILSIFLHSYLPPNNSMPVALKMHCVLIRIKTLFFF